MLTKDQLRFTRRGERIYPRFLDPENKSLRQLAEDLLTLYKNGIGETREALEELTQPIVLAYHALPVSKGINKLLMDRCRFSEPDDSCMDLRAKLFPLAAQQIQSPSSKTLEVYRDAVALSVTSKDAEQLAAQIYADHPARQILEKFRSISSEEVLHRYNLAQVQGLLLHSDRMICTIEEPRVERLRQLFRYLKFFRLLARITPHSKKRYTITVDGPLSLFEKTRQYGLQLAAFFPAVCLLAQWHLQATVRLKGATPLTIKLDQTRDLKSHYMPGYLPDEIKVFVDQFKKKITVWSLQEETAPLMEIHGQHFAVPDMSFTHTSEERSTITVHLELFHRWHANPLIDRLKILDASMHTTMGHATTDQKTGPRWAVGVDRTLNKRPEVKSLLSESVWFQKHGFFFNTFPPVNRVIQCLDGFLKTSSSASKNALPSEKSSQQASK